MKDIKLKDKIAQGVNDLFISGNGSLEPPSVTREY